MSLSTLIRIPLVTHLNLIVVPVFKTSQKNCLSRTTDWLIDILLVCSSLLFVIFLFVCMCMCISACMMCVSVYVCVFEFKLVCFNCLH